MGYAMLAKASYPTMLKHNIYISAQSKDVPLQGQVKIWQLWTGA